MIQVSSIKEEEPIHVLFIDDEPYLLNLGRLFLEKFGKFKVTTIQDVDEVFSTLSQNTFDAIVSDYHMPKMDGITLLTILKEKGDETPFIIFTGRGREEVVIEALNKGADFYIQKSGDPKSEFTELTSKIRYAVSRRRSEKELETVLTNLKRSQQVAHIGNWTLDTEKGEFSFSEEGLAIFGFPNNYPITIEEVLSTIHPSDRKTAEKMIARLLKTGESFNIDIKIIRRDSGEIRHIQSQGQLIQNNHDDTHIIFGTNLDITERKKVQEKLSETNSYLENLIGIASVPIIIMDPSYCITRINRAGEDLIGQSADQVLGRSIQTLLAPDKADIGMERIVSSSANDTPVRFELEVLRSDGSIRTVLWNSATLYENDQKTPVATIAQGQDITARLKLERQRDATEIQIQQNLAQLAILNDGIRNPLMAISGYTELFGDEKISGKILLQVNLINEMVTQIDRRWAESEKILNFLRKHSEVETDDLPGTLE